MLEVTVIPYGTRQYVNVLPSDNDLYCPTHLIMFCCNFHTKWRQTARREIPSIYQSCNWVVIFRDNVLIKRSDRHIWINDGSSISKVKFPVILFRLEFMLSQNRMPKFFFFLKHGKQCITKILFYFFLLPEYSPTPMWHVIFENRSLLLTTSVCSSSVEE